MTRTWLLVLGALATIGFAALVLVAVPQIMLVRVPAPKQLAPYTPEQARGRRVYIENGCLYCHSQQVRDPAFTTDIGRGWGSRATVPADYVYDRPHLLGTMRTGPDLINVGARLPDPNWHLVHLYNPRIVVPWSIMPSFRFLFAERTPGEGGVRPGEQAVLVPGPRAPRGKVVVATPDAVALVAYLLSLKREYPVPFGQDSLVGGKPGAATSAVHNMP
jgi:cytochrome c oxidase cbb3-type subunit 2